MLFHNVTCYTTSLLSYIHVDTTNILNIMRTLVAMHDIREVKVYYYSNTTQNIGLTWMREAPLLDMSRLNLMSTPTNSVNPGCYQVFEWWMWCAMWQPCDTGGIDEVAGFAQWAFSISERQWKTKEGFALHSKEHAAGEEKYLLWVVVMKFRISKSAQK